MRPALPPPVLPGDRVGVAALSSAVNPELLAQGVEGLRRLGYEPVVASNLSSAYGPLAGDDRERLEGFHCLAGDPSIKAVVFARGGYGLTRLLEQIDWELLERFPRAYVGYSDLTPFLLAVIRRLGLVSFHGPMVASDFAHGLCPDEADRFRRALRGDLPTTLPVGGWVRRGDARGVLLGGCLSMVVALIGTRWMPKLDGSILFLEDVDEPPYRLDRMLTHLGLSGNLAGVTGTVFGHLGEDAEGVAEAWHRETLLGLPGPVAIGLDCGHCRPNLILPLGLSATLDSGGWLRIG